MKKSVLLLVTDLEVGGAPLHVKDLARGLDPAHFSVSVACLAPEGPIAVELRRDAIPTYCLGASSRWDLRVFYRLGRLIASQRPDILHCHLVHANTVGRIVGKLLRVPHIIASIHTAEHQQLWHLALEKLTCRLSDFTVCVSPSVLRHVQRHCQVPPERLRMIPNGVDVDRFVVALPLPLAELGLSETQPTILFVGRLDPVKGVDVLLRAVSSLKARHDLQLLIVGDGSLRGALTDLAGQLHIADRTCFAGTRRDVERLMRTASMMVMPSHWEGLPLTALEAMAAGLPIIASDTDGLADVINHLKTGLLVRPGNPSQLSAAIEELLSDLPLAEKLASTAQDQIRNAFSLTAMLQQYTLLYNSL